MRCKMMKYMLLFLGCYLIIACNNEVKKQPLVISDSHTEFVTIQTKDTAYINNLLKKAKIIVDAHTDSAIAIYLNVVDLSRQINYIEGLAHGYDYLTYCFLRKEDFTQADICATQAIVYFEKSIAALSSLNQKSKLQRLYRILIYRYREQGAFHKIIRTYRVAHSLYDSRDSIQKQQLIEISINNADAYRRLGQYDSAFVYYYKLLKLFDKTNKDNYKALADIYQGLSSINSHMEFPVSKSLFWKKQIKTLSEKYADTNIMVRTMGELGALYHDLKDYEKAKFYAYKALDLIQKAKVHDTSTALLLPASVIAGSLIAEGKPEEALPYSKMVLRNAPKGGFKTNEVIAMYLMGYNYQELKQYAQAEKYLLAGLNLSQETDNFHNITNAYEQLGFVYFGMKQYKKAYLYKSKYIEVRDSLRSKENASRLAEINAKYQVAEKDKEVFRTQLQLERQQKRQYLVVGVALLFISFLLILLYRRRQKAAMEKLRANLEGEEKERARIARELHDGIVSRLSLIKTNFSTLPQYYKNDHESMEFQEIIHQLDQSIMELRTTSHNLLPETLKRFGLIESLQVYCSKINDFGPLEITFQPIGELPPLADEFQLNVYRIIQELINNIIKHSGATQVLIQFYVRSHTLEITVDDNGISTEKIPVKNQTGIGLNNINSRVKFLDGTIEIEHNKGTSVYLIFDLKKFITKS